MDDDNSNNDKDNCYCTINNNKANDYTKNNNCNNNK